MMAYRILVKCAEHRLHLRDPPCVRRSRSRQPFIKQLVFVFPSKKRSHFQKYVCLSFRAKPSRDETGIYFSSSVRGRSRDDAERGVIFFPLQPCSRVDSAAQRLDFSMQGAPFEKQNIHH